MAQVSRDVKRRYFQKKLEQAPFIQCECGCGSEIKAIDNYGRPKKFVNGHNRQQYPHQLCNSHTAATKRWRRRNPEKHNNARQLRRRARKIELIISMGGKCVNCGMEYNGKNGTNFEFHHTDPVNKEHTVTEMLELSIERVLIEANKCLLWCAHCHNIHHNGEW
jgi:hypothetical protein